MKVTALLTIYLCSLNARVFGITGGQPADEGEFPFMVSLRTDDNCHFCGGTIIADRWILTSNICYSAAWWGSISFGTNKLPNTNTSGYGSCAPYNNSIQRYIDDVLYNPLAEDRAPYQHDMVLIHLNESIPFGENVQPVQLPDIDEVWPDNKTGTILGWSLGSDRNLQLDLQKAQVPLYSDEYCVNSSLWGGWELPNPVVMKCGGEVNNTYYCMFDVGGPLLVDGKQFGIMSYIRKDPEGSCGTYLGIFSPVSYFRQWIKDTTGV